MIKRRTLALVLVLPMAAIASENLCPPRPDAETNDFAMQEADFTLEKGRESANFFRDDFAKRIWGPKAVKDFTWSGHYISYANNLRFMEGALLREHALRLQATASLAERTDPKSGETKKAKAAFAAAKEAFCAYVASSDYVD